MTPNDPTSRPAEAHAHSELVENARRQADSAQKIRPSMEQQSLPAGSIPGHLILEELHRGGQGVVYKAIQQSTKRQVALKVLKDGVFASATERARFSREVEILARLKHPNIVSVHIGGTASGHRYFVMDFIDGEPLDTFMSAADQPILKTLTLFHKICTAVGAAHLRGVVHRDLKPSNIRIDKAGQPHILDFGLAKVTSEKHNSATNVATVTGYFVGSLPWATPEQASGDSDSIDVRTDVYALGVVLFQMLTNKFPYPVVGFMGEVLDHIRGTEPKRPSVYRREINNELDTIILKCLQKDPSRRYQSAVELARDVERLLAGEPIEAKRDSTWYVLSKTMRRHRAVAAVMGAMAILTVAYAATLTVLYRRAVTAEQRAVAAGRQSMIYANEARAQFGIATDALAFVIGEVSDRLRDVAGASEARRAILEEAFKKLRALSTEHSGDPILRSEVAKTHVSLGDISLSFGDVAQAATQFEIALGIRRELVARDPKNAQYLDDMSISLVRVGDAYQSANDNSRTRNLYEEALVVDKQLAATYPTNAHYQDNLSWSYDRLAALAQAEGNFGLAKEYCREQQRLARGLVADEPDNPLRQFALFAAKQRRMRLAYDSGNEVAARLLVDDVVQCGERLVSMSPLNPLFARRVVGAYIAAGAFAYHDGFRDRSQAYFTKGLAIAEAAVAADPEIVENQEVLSSILNAIVPCERSLGDLRQATKHAVRAYETASALAKLPVSRVDIHIETRVFDTALAVSAIANELGDVGTARKYLERALAVGARATREPNVPIRLVRDYASLLTHAFVVELRDPDRAISVVQRAIELRGESPEMLMSLGQAYCASGDAGRGVDILGRAMSKVSTADSPLRRQLQEATGACNDNHQSRRPSANHPATSPGTSGQ